MKLIKKILPLVTIGATACTLAPALTACGNGGDKKEEVTVYTITFDANGGQAVPAQKAVKGELIHEPTTAKTGYTLAGWYNGDKLWDFAKDKATSDVTLKAAWVDARGVDLLSFDILEPIQHEETSVETVKEAGKMYFAEDGVSAEDIKLRVKYDILSQLAWNVKEAAAALIVEPGSMEGYEWVGRVKTAKANVQVSNVTYDATTNKAKISGSIVLEINTDYIDETTKAVKGEYILITQHQLTNMVYEINDYGEADHYWSVRTNANFLTTNDWNLKRSYYGACIGDDGTIEDIPVETAEWNHSTALPTEVNLKPISFDSTFMDTVEHGK